MGAVGRKGPRKRSDGKLPAASAPAEKSTRQPEPRTGKPALKISRMQVPTATYRLQLSGLSFAGARELVPYLDDLGIAAAYLSPFFRARQGSSHGYDVVDHRQLDPSLGDERDLERLAKALADNRMGLILDVVPNHMGIDDPNNAWWQDVLENGHASSYAKYFDIDWNPPKADLRGKVLLPVLGDQFGKILEDQQLTLGYEDQRFVIGYFDRRLPTDPCSWVPVLRQVIEAVAPRLDSEREERMELESVTTALEHLPPRTQVDDVSVQQRYRESEVTRRRLAVLFESCGEIREALDQALAIYNGRKGEPASFDKLEALLANQPYRLCYWRVATDEINYRRFFDIDALGAIRVEDPEVFAAVHELVLRYVQNGWITGLRVDHADGLLDPQRYLTNLVEAAGRALGDARYAQPPVQLTSEELNKLPSADDRTQAPIYVVAEKILAHDESLPSEWPIQGTTGYDFLNVLNGVFVDRGGGHHVRNSYVRFTGLTDTFAQILYESKRAILATSLSSELYTLSHRLDRISEQHRWSRDFTRLSLSRALREVVACFPVYRTYVRPGSDLVRDEDRRRVLAAVRSAKRRNPAMSPTFFDFIASVLLLEDPAGLSEENRQQRREFVLRFQQITGPVTAKGLEDTAFYRFYPLASLNEVGGDLTAPGTPLDRFHAIMQERAQTWPHDMSTTGTHDTKRGEDIRARLNVLSETPEAWEEAIWRWQSVNASTRIELDGAPVPDANEEYLIYQTLVGTWPLGPLDDQQRQTYVDRVVAYLDKALREAKIHTSWLNPYEEYDQAVAGFIRKILEKPESPFVQDLDAFARSIADAGFVNSLAQTLAKIAAPGVPDFYQGVEFWDFNLVDPDNRRPVDFEARREALAWLMSHERGDLPRLASELLSQWPDPRLKMFLIWRALSFRRAHAELFEGSYVPVEVAGERDARLCAFARTSGSEWAVCLVPRFARQAWTDMGQPPPSTTLKNARWPIGDWWRDTLVRLPGGAPTRWRHVITDEIIEPVGHGGGGDALDAGQILLHFPVALLTNADD
jgi:(1->4)-alpha-D-glucan 1-alpha-D-glucosylmutase